MANCIVGAGDLRPFEVKDDHKIKRAGTVPFFQEPKHANTGPETIQASDGQRRDVMHQNITMKEIRLTKRRIELPLVFNDFTVGQNLDGMRSAVKQLGNQFDLDRVGKAAIPDDGTLLQQTRPLIRRDIRYFHGAYSTQSASRSRPLLVCGLHHYAVAFFALVVLLPDPVVA